MNFKKNKKGKDFTCAKFSLIWNLRHVEGATEIGFSLLVYTESADCSLCMIKKNRIFTYLSGGLIMAKVYLVVRILHKDNNFLK